MRDCARRLRRRSLRTPAAPGRVAWFRLPAVPALLFLDRAGSGAREQPLCRIRGKLIFVRLIAAREHELRLALQYGERDLGAGFELDAGGCQWLAVACRLQAERGRQPPFV